MPYDKNKLLEERGQFCECGCGFFCHDCHHCLIPNLKRFSAYLNDPRNIALVNHAEHVEMRKFDCLEWRHKFWIRNVQRYGYNAMMEWVNELPTKLKYRLDFIEEI